MTNDLKSLFLIAPVFNEEGNLPLFCSEVEKMSSLIDYKVNLVLVDDGSIDRSQEIIKNYLNQEKKIVVSALFFSRNFGHQSAISAGLDYSIVKSKLNDNSLFLMMDSDLEHPPSLIPEMLSYFKENNLDHLQMVRVDNTKISLFKKMSSKFFYFLFRLLTQVQIPSGCSDFRCFNLNVASSFQKITEVDRLNRGLFWWMGFKLGFMKYNSPQRKFGKTKFSLNKMFNLGLSGITSFSSIPLMVIQITLVVAGLTLFSFYILYELKRFFYDDVQFAVGWISIIATIFFWGGLLSLGQLMQSIYISKILIEVKKRPLYIVKEKYE